jgi:transcriptional regulator with XRE-family HTH domain
MTTGEIVCRILNRKGITEKQLAEKAGVSLQTIYNIEADRTSPKMDTMLAIMRALDYEIRFVKRYKGGYYDE